MTSVYKILNPHFHGMSKIKSEKFKKLEQELADLQRWLDLGLVPKKDLEKHNAEIKSLKQKIEEEKSKLAETKDGNEPEEYIAPKRAGAKQAFTEQSNIPDVDASDDSSDEEEDLGSDDSYVTDDYDSSDDTDDSDDFEEDEDDPFSDRNRWRRGVLEDPDSDNW